MENYKKFLLELFGVQLYQKKNFARNLPCRFHLYRCKDNLCILHHLKTAQAL